MRIVERAEFIAGKGIEGDRHATLQVGRWDYQVLLMDEETLQELDLSTAIVKENVTTAVIDLYSLTAGQKLLLGDHVKLEISKPCVPCSRMDEIRPGLQGELEGRRGMLAFVVQGGFASVDDSIRLI